MTNKSIFDCMGKIEPMLAQSSEPFDSDDWLFEVKWDGSRALGFVDNDETRTRTRETRLQNRRFVDISQRYPEIQIELEGHSAIFDGEVIVLNNGKSSFNDLQHREHLKDKRKIEAAMTKYPASYVIWDVLNIDEKDITSLPLIERKELLRDLDIESNNEDVFLSDHVIGNGKKYFERAVKLGLEGIMAKRINSPYSYGKRSKHWLKIKKEVSVDCIICGATLGEGRRSADSVFGALILGAYHDGELTYIGKVGTGFSDDDLEIMASMLDRIRVTKCPFEDVPSGLDVKCWYNPQVICEISGMEITSALSIRAPVFNRIRTDKPLKECVI